MGINPREARWVLGWMNYLSAYQNYSNYID
jgi:hypothetical protein